MKKIIISSVVFFVILIVVGCFFGARLYSNFQNDKKEQEKIAHNLIESQQEELLKTKLEVRNLKEEASNKPDCGDISLDNMAPGYTFEDLQKFTDQLNKNNLSKNLSAINLKYLYNSFYATQWKNARPECESYINSLIESKKAANQQLEQNEEIKKVLEQQNKLMKYNQCMAINNDGSFCQLLSN